MHQGEHSVILSTFIKLPIVIKIFVLSIFEWPFYTGFAAHVTQLATGKISLFQLVSLAAQAGLNITWSETTKTSFFVSRPK